MKKDIEKIELDEFNKEKFDDIINDTNEIIKYCNWEKINDVKFMCLIKFLNLELKKLC